MQQYRKIECEDGIAVYQRSAPNQALLAMHICGGGVDVILKEDFDFLDVVNTIAVTEIREHTRKIRALAGALMAQLSDQGTGSSLDRPELLEVESDAGWQLTANIMRALPQAYERHLNLKVQPTDADAKIVLHASEGLIVARRLELIHQYERLLDELEDIANRVYGG